MSAEDGRALVTLLLSACVEEKAQTSFDSRYPPALDAYQYMERLRTRLTLTSEQIWLASHYLHRFLLASKEPVARSSAHRLLATSVVLAQKFDEDVPCSERSYASVVGVALKELTHLQILFLRAVEYRLMYPCLEPPLESALERASSEDARGGEEDAVMHPC